MIWKATGNYNSISEMISAKAGCSPEELINPKRAASKSIQNLEAALETIQNAVYNDDLITIVGDYDADGITSTAILTKLIRHIGAEPQTVIPRRFSEGYGVSESIIRAIPAGGLIVTIDNGIMAVNEIALAKALGNKVVIIDHHLPGDTIPDADIVVDPHISPKDNGYYEYCGAGLALKLAEEYILKRPSTAESTSLLMELYVLAAIGTIADVMPLTGDNRFIVKKGLNLINTRFNELPFSLTMLLGCADTEVYDEESIAYKIAPLINAPGRLYDAGGSSVLKALLCNDRKDTLHYTMQLKLINEKRKAATEKALKIVCDEIEMGGLHECYPICAFVPGIPEGLVGLITGKLTEKYKRPAFLLTNSKEEGLLKGSGRTYKDFDLKPLLDAAVSVLERGGGHSGAAGISVRLDRLSELISTFSRAAGPKPSEEDEVVEYDMVIRAEDVPGAIEELRRFAPFGSGVPKPVFVIKDFTAMEKYGEYYKIMGSANNHLKLHGSDFSAVGFSLAEDYIAMGKPKTITIAGTLGENVFRGMATPQMMLSHMRISEK